MMDGEEQAQNPALAAIVEAGNPDGLPGRTSRRADKGLALSPVRRVTVSAMRTAAQRRGARSADRPTRARRRAGRGFGR